MTEKRRILSYSGMRRFSFFGARINLQKIDESAFKIEKRFSGLTGKIWQKRLEKNTNTSIEYH